VHLAVLEERLHQQLAPFAELFQRAVQHAAAHAAALHQAAVVGVLFDQQFGIGWRGGGAR
jgi:hypothetical protein